jgi:hypothetical protein
LSRLLGADFPHPSNRFLRINCFLVFYQSGSAKLLL